MARTTHAHRSSRRAWTAAGNLVSKFLHLQFYRADAHRKKQITVIKPNEGFVSWHGACSSGRRLDEVHSRWENIDYQKVPRGSQLSFRLFRSNRLFRVMKAGGFQ